MALDEDRPGGRCAPCSAGEDGAGGWGEQLSVWTRSREYTDADGNPRWEWASAGAGRGVLRVTRSEVDDTTGHTTHSGQVVMSWPDDVAAPTETAVVVDEQQHRWHISRVDAFPGGLRLQVSRVSDAD